jgi:UDP:flavonoid glycosyltransferase YjiC (YdhE family)
MLKVLFTVVPAAGHLHPTIPMALALQQRGHEVCYATGRSRLSLLQRLGLPATAILPGRADTAAQIMMPVEAHRDTYNPIRIFAQIRFLLDLMIDALKELEALASAWNPDVLVVDFSTPVGGALANRLDIPWVSVTSVPACLRTQHGTPVFLGGLCRPRHLGHRVRDWGGRRLHELLRWSLSTLFADRFGRLGLRLNLPAGGDGLYSPYAILSVGVREIEFERDWPPHLHWIGPADWSDAGPLAPEVQAFWATKEPKVFATLGTEQFEEKEGRLALIADTLERLPYRSVVGCGGNVSLPGRGYRRIQVASYVHYGEVLKQADVVVHHGGAGILYSTLMAGKPAVVVPQGKDQFDNAQRVVDAGVGVRIDGRRLAADRLAAAVTQLMDTQEVHLAAQRLAEQLRSYDPVPHAVALIERVARERRTILADETAPCGFE